MKLNSTMSHVLPFDIIALIIDIVGENNDTDLLKELALVSYSFLQISSKHLFATIELHDADSEHHVTSSKKGFVKLLKSRPDVVKYIRKLTYNVSRNDYDDHQLSLILSNLLPTFSRLNSLSITASHQDWNTLDSSLTSALLHLMYLPTINHIDLSYIRNFPLSSLTPSVNLHRLGIFNMMPFDPRFDPYVANSWPELVQSDMMPKIRDFRTSQSGVLTTKLLHAKRQDGQPAFNFMDLRRLSISFMQFEDGQNIRYLLQNAKLLEKLYLDVGYMSLAKLLSLSPPTLKVLDLTVTLYALGWICEELEAMAGHNMLEVFSLEVDVYGNTENFLGSNFRNVEKVLVKPGWSALRQVSFKISISSGWDGDRANLCEALQSLPNKYLSHLPKLESIAFDYSANIV